MATNQNATTVGTSNARGAILNIRNHLEAAVLLTVHADAIKARSVVSIACDIVHGIGILARDTSNDPGVLREDDLTVLYKGLIRDIATFKAPAAELRKAIIADLMVTPNDTGPETNEARGEQRAVTELQQRKQAMLQKALPLAALLHHLIGADKVPEYKNAGSLRIEAASWLPQGVDAFVRVLLMVRRGKNSRTAQTWREGDKPELIEIPIDGTHTISFDAPSGEGVTAKHVRNTVEELLANHKPAKGAGKGALNMLRAIELLAAMDSKKPPTVPADKLPACNAAKKMITSIIEASTMKINKRKAAGKANKASAKVKKPVPVTTPPAPPLAS
jgi:hypothetical protein